MNLVCRSRSSPSAPCLCCTRTTANLPPTVAYGPSGIKWLGDSGIEAFIRREVLPYAPDAWYMPGSVKVGYEISFTREFYKPQPLRPLEEIRADILAVEKETEGLLGEIIGG